MPNNWFRFRHFMIMQDQCAMKVGTDSVLLGSWLKLEGREQKIVDLGTGSGVLALIMAQRSQATVVGIESDPLAANQADENFAASPWSERLILIQGDIQRQGSDDFDLCIFNPPYFNGQLKSSVPSRNHARHMSDQRPQEWMDACRRLLHDQGKVGFIIPVREESVWLEAALASGFFPEEKVLVSGRPEKDPVRILYRMGRQKTNQNQSYLTLETNQRGIYTTEFRQLVAEIYPEKV